MELSPLLSIRNTMIYRSVVKCDPSLKRAFPKRSYGKYQACTLKTPNFQRLWLAVKIPYGWPPSQSEGRGPVAPLTHRTIVSPLLFPNSDSYVSIKRKISARWMLCKITYSRSLIPNSRNSKRVIRSRRRIDRQVLLRREIRCNKFVKSAREKEPKPINN